MSLADDVYRTLEAAIAEGRIRPNQRLVEQDLARQLGISRTPVREALHRLRGVGFVDGGRQSWTVREHTPADIRDLFEVRIALEGQAAVLAAQRATADELAVLRDLHARAEPCHGLERRDELVRLNDAFHAQVLVAAHNAPLERLARQYHRHHFNYRTARLYSEAQARSAIAEHAEILAALCARDGERARAAVTGHLQRGQELALRSA